jgi:flap endonuclease-1
MGVKIFDIVPHTDITFDDLRNRIIIVDGNLSLYQFLASIRQRDGSLLTDSKGNVTSHLSGLFTRTLRMIQAGIQVSYVFDGKPPKLKLDEQKRRSAIKVEAEIKYKEAAIIGDTDLMRKYASRTSKLTKDMVEESKELLTAMGLPVVQAPGEGEAQAALIVGNGDAYAVGSQDGDCFMFGAKRLIKNLTLSSQRRIGGRSSFAKFNPELIELDKVISTLGIDQDQLIILSMLIGTDFNIGGIKGIGPKNAIKMVKKYNKDYASLFSELKWEDYFQVSWEEVYNQIKNIPTSKEYDLTWDNVNAEKIKKILVDRHEFSSERIENSLNKLNDSSKLQTGLKQWL